VLGYILGDFLQTHLVTLLAMQVSMSYVPTWCAISVFNGLYIIPTYNVANYLQQRPFLEEPASDYPGKLERVCQKNRRLPGSQIKTVPVTSLGTLVAREYTRCLINAS
jgi:hypothetical protein